MRTKSGKKTLFALLISFLLPPTGVGGLARKSSSGQQESVEGFMPEAGEAVIGQDEEWLVPAHLEPQIYWLNLAA